MENLIVCFALDRASLSSCMNEYLAIGSGGHLCTHNPRSLIAAWLDASNRSQDELRLNTPGVKRFVRS